MFDRSRSEPDAQKPLLRTKKESGKTFRFIGFLILILVTVVALYKKGSFREERVGVKATPHKSNSKDKGGKGKDKGGKRPPVLDDDDDEEDFHGFPSWLIDRQNRAMEFHPPKSTDLPFLRLREYAASEDLWDHCVGQHGKPKVDPHPGHAIEGSMEAGLGMPLEAWLEHLGKHVFWPAVSLDRKEDNEDRPKKGLEPKTPPDRDSFEWEGSIQRVSEMDDDKISALEAQHPWVTEPWYTVRVFKAILTQLDSGLLRTAILMDLTVYEVACIYLWTEGGRLGFYTRINKALRGVRHASQVWDHIPPHYRTYFMIFMSGLRKIRTPLTTTILDVPGATGVEGLQRAPPPEETTEVDYSRTDFQYNKGIPLSTDPDYPVLKEMPVHPAAPPPKHQRNDYYFSRGMHFPKPEIRDAVLTQFKSRPNFELAGFTTSWPIACVFTYGTFGGATYMNYADTGDDAPTIQGCEFKYSFLFKLPRDKAYLMAPIWKFSAYPEEMEHAFLFGTYVQPMAGSKTDKLPDDPPPPRPPASWVEDPEMEVYYYANEVEGNKDVQKALQNGFTTQRVCAEPLEFWKPYLSEGSVPSRDVSTVPCNVLKMAWGQQIQPKCFQTGGPEAAKGPDIKKPADIPQEEIHKLDYFLEKHPESASSGGGSRGASMQRSKSFDDRDERESDRGGKPDLRRSKTDPGPLRGGTHP